MERCGAPAGRLRRQCDQKECGDQGCSRCGDLGCGGARLLRHLPGNGTCGRLPGIELTLTLSPDGRYEQTWNYIEREGIFTDRGPYMVEGDVLTLQPEDDGVALYYKLDGERLLKLDADRKPLDGEQAPYYELRKIAK